MVITAASISAQKTGFRSSARQFCRARTTLNSAAPSASGGLRKPSVINGKRMTRQTSDSAM